MYANLTPISIKLSKQNKCMYEQNKKIIIPEYY